MNTLNNRFAVYFVLALALLLRLLAISARPLWYDEAFSVLFAEKGPQAILAGTLGSDEAASEEHPLLYYTLLWGWMKVLGETPPAVRSFSVLCGVGIVYLAYLLGRQLFDKRFGLTVAGITAISPFQIHYAQEARMYALMTFLLLGATCALWMGMRGGGWGWWLLFGVSAALGQYTHNLAAFYLLPLALTPLWMKDWRSSKAVVLSGLGALLLYAPWLMRLPAQFAKIQGNFWIERPSPSRLIATLLSFVVDLPVPEGWLPLALFVTFSIVALALWQTWLAWRRRREGLRWGLWLFYLAFAPPVFLFLFSQWQPIFIERALLPSGVIFVAWLGWAFSWTKMPEAIRTLAFLLLVVGMLLGNYHHVSYTGFPYGPYAALDAYLARYASGEDVILHSNKLTLLPMVYYGRDLPQRYLADPPGSGADTLAPATQEVLGLIADPNPEAAVGESRRVWFVIFERAIEEYRDLGYSAHPHLEWLNSRFILEKISNWGDLLLYVYVKK
ncbi:MAG: hypothetical protein FJ010_06105 [Chloroflexi bacterium]|nr:hypothetical protein [Chloroflexota bacterium]